MADIRINALAGTATSSASDDYLAIDGAANGTRKLSAYSPTFGGNLTINGTGASSVAGPLAVTGTLTAFVGSNIGGIYSYYSGGGVLASYSTNTGTLSQTTIDGSTIVLRPGGSSAQITATTTGATLAGNLTVSGGSIGVGGAIGSYLDILQGGNDAYFYNRRAGSLIFGTNNSTVMSFPASGNCLIGTSTDSSNGKLQLATHTTSAGGIGFGTDTSLYRTAAGEVGFGSTGVNSFVGFYDSGGYKGTIGTSGGDMYLGTQTAKPVYLRTNATTALTLDSSQAATFSQGVKISGLGPVFSASSSAVYNQIVGGVTPQIQWINSSGGTDSKVVDWLVTSNQLQGRFVNDTNGAANNWLTVTRSNYSVTSVAFGGPIKLANAYVATPQVSTGYVTIQDSTGTTYKVLVAP